MGTYLNPDNSKFQESINSDIYVDKTGLITYTNSVIHTQQKCICVSRPRRFGKSMPTPICFLHITAVAVIQKNYFKILRSLRMISLKHI
ncbi:MAG: AAA family ATPase [Eubacterium ramulus]